jgi:hypothetical protein
MGQVARKFETASQAYGRNVTAALETLKALEAALLANDCRQATWPQVGDVAYVNELLDQAAEFYLNGK